MGQWPERNVSAERPAGAFHVGGAGLSPLVGEMAGRPEGALKGENGHAFSPFVTDQIVTGISDFQPQ